MQKTLLSLALLAISATAAASQTTDGLTDAPQASPCFNAKSISSGEGSYYTTFTLTNICKDFSLKGMAVQFQSNTPVTNFNPTASNGAYNNGPQNVSNKGNTVSLQPNFGGNMTLTQGQTVSLSMSTSQKIDTREVIQSMQVYGQGTPSDSAALTINNNTAAPQGDQNNPIVDVMQNGKVVSEKAVAWQGSTVITTLAPGSYQVVAKDFIFNNQPYHGSMNPTSVTLSKGETATTTVSYAQTALNGAIKVNVPALPSAISGYASQPTITLQSADGSLSKSQPLYWGQSNQVIKQLASNTLYQLVEMPITFNDSVCKASFSPATLTASDDASASSTVSYQCNNIQMDPVTVNVSGLAKATVSSVQLSFTPNNGTQPINTTITINGGSGSDSVSLQDGVIYNVASSTVPDYVANFTPATLSVTKGASESVTYTASDAHYSPFVDATAYPKPILGTQNGSGVMHYVLGFIVSAMSKDGTTPECKASWGTYYTVPDYMQQDIANLRTQGGDVIVSLGGQANTPLAESCSDVNSLAAQYESIIDAYQLTHLDFDIEGMWVSAAYQASITRRAQALAQIQQNPKYANLQVWLTLPVLPNGLNADGLNALNTILDNKVKIAGVNIMAMDYGNDTLPNPNGEMGDAAIQAMSALHEQLQSALAKHNINKTDAEVWQMIGVTPMIGMNDNTDEIFTLTDAQKVAEFAKQHNIGLVSDWSFNRDHSCGAQWTSTTCTSENKYTGQPNETADWQYAKTFEQGFGK